MLVPGHAEKVPTPSTFGDPANTFHEKAILCRAAENTCYVASVNVASLHSPTTSAVARPDSSVLRYQPYGKEGLLLGDLDLDRAIGRWSDYGWSIPSSQPKIASSGEAG